MGAYQLTARLGAGGMGVVYLGEAADGGLVAVKVLRPELADDQEFRARFGREVAALARVSGVCTVRMIEADTTSACPFMVTEYAAGPSLSEYVAEHGPVGADMLYGLATGLAEALTAIHAAGVVHRDLKPSNVILGRDGPKVIDFGIAQALDATGLTQTGMMVGSAGFMAPEQVTGRAGHEADVFAWAVTLAYAASGQMPFGTGLSDAILYRVLHEEPDIVAVPALLKPLVTAALAKDPRYRPGARDLLEQLANPAARPGRDYDARTQAVLARTWPGTEASPVPPPRAGGSLLLEPAQAARQPWTRQPWTRQPWTRQPWTRQPWTRQPWTRQHGPGRSPARRRLAAITVPAAAVIAVALALALLTGRIATFGLLTANQVNQGTVPAAFGVYPGQQQRGVFQSIGRIVAAGTTVVAMGSQVSDGVVRQQFFVSANGGASWRLAPVRAPGGGQPPLGYPAARLAGGPGGWLAVGPQAIWTSPDGTAWTLAATHGITPQLPGDQLCGAHQHRAAVTWPPARPRPPGGDPGRPVDLPGRPDLAAPDGRPAGPGRPRRDRHQHRLHHHARPGHGHGRRGGQWRHHLLRRVAEHRRRDGLDPGHRPGRSRRGPRDHRAGVRRFRSGRGAPGPFGQRCR